MVRIDELVKQIESFAYLEEGWDSYEAETITPAAIESATRMIYQLTEKHWLPDYVFPTPDGGVLLEWLYGGAERNELHIDTDSDGLYGYLSVVDDDMTEANDIGIERALALILEVS